MGKSTISEAASLTGKSSYAARLERLVIERIPVRTESGAFRTNSRRWKALVKEAVSGLSSRRSFWPSNRVRAGARRVSCPFSPDRRRRCRTSWQACVKRSVSLKPKPTFPPTACAMQYPLEVASRSACLTIQMGVTWQTDACFVFSFR